MYANQQKEEGNYKQAEQLFKAAMTINPEHETVLLFYGILLMNTGRHAKALAMLEKGDSLYPENQYYKPNIKALYYDYGKSEADTGNYNKAINLLKEALVLFPDELFEYVIH